jgi:hypothetical protein
MKTPVFLILFILLSLFLYAQQRPKDNNQLVTCADMDYLEQLTREVVDSSRVFPGQDLPYRIKSYGPNNSGITLIKPGGRDCYPSFWIRDYAMSLESDLISIQEQLDILMYVASKQSDNSWWTKSGSLVPFGSIPDHIRFNDGLPIYFPGTYSYQNQGDTLWKRPPYDNQFFFIHMAWYYLEKTRDFAVLLKKINNISLIDRLEISFKVVPAHWQNQLVHIDKSFITCDFGFRDVIIMSGDVCFGSLLKYRAALELSWIFGQLGNPEKSDHYTRIAEKIKDSLAGTFTTADGMLKASTGTSNQPDVWATAFAVIIGALDRKANEKACTVLANAYRNGTLAMKGYIRHVRTTDDYSKTTAWEKSLAGKNTYQNGAYWGTATGWVCYAIAQQDTLLAHTLAKEYINFLRKTDFRLNRSGNGGPYECIYPPADYYQNPVYMTSVTCPYAAFKLSGFVTASEF